MISIKRSGKNFLLVPMGTSVAIHAVLLVSLLFLSWEKTSPKPETPPIKIQNVFLQPQKTATAIRQETSKSATQHANLAFKGIPSGKNPSTRKSQNIEPDIKMQPAVMVSNPIRSLSIPKNSHRQPQLINFSTSAPVALVKQTVQQAPSIATHSTRSPRPPASGLGEPLALIAKNIASHPGRSFANPSPQRGVTARTISNEFSSTALQTSPATGVKTVERWIPTSRTRPIQIASIPSDFIDDNKEDNSQALASTKTQHPEGALDSSGEDREAIRKGFTSGVWGRIAKVQYYPTRARKRGWEGKPVVEFLLARNGNLISSSIALASPYRILDEAALDAIKSAVPYPKIPEALKLDSIRFKLPISFILEEP